MIYLRLYNLILFIAAFFLVPYYVMRILLTGKYRKSIGAKFGFIPRDSIENMKGSPRIWVHAVSVGEVTAAAPIVSSLRELFPSACIILSTSTETGQDMARRMVPDATSYIYYPLDIPFVVRKVINLTEPDIFVPVETEIWPNFIRICREKGLKIVMVNGRISPRSFKRYSKTKFFWRNVLTSVDEMGMISPVDAERITALGVNSSRVSIVGNAKYDSLASRADDTLKHEMSNRLSIAPGSRVFVAGSTHDGEETVVLRVYKKLLEYYPDFLLVIIPRHIERRGEVLSCAEEEGFNDCITMSDMNRGKRRTRERVTIIDVIGELFKIYSLATIVFCGGSLVPRGGQNILEPAAWGKVIFYGPSMEDFSDEKRLLEEAGAGITVTGEEDLFKEIRKVMGDTARLSERGEAGRRIVASNMGASRRYAEMISAWLGERAEGD
ncbi:MAG: 3-deoxy-D-manno-octulosonic acid transferase [Deltaproteobacteria bacterium]|nr:3-deoxy-D-manno-octulosonic acid transferase [Deltaproteobacteria bacterium]